MQAQSHSFNFKSLKKRLIHQFLKKKLLFTCTYEEIVVLGSTKRGDGGAMPGQDPDEAAAAHVIGVNAAVTGADDGATIVSCDANGLNLLRAITIANEK